MTHDDLATLIRDDLAASEPAGSLDAMVPMRLGRRRLRARRLASGVATTVVVAVGAAIAVPFAVEHNRPPPPLLDHEPTLAAHVRPVFEQSVPDLGPASTTGDADHSMVRFGDLRRELSVTVDHRVTGSLEPADRYCTLNLQAGFAACHLHTDTTGAMVVDEVVAQQVLGALGTGRDPGYGFATVPLDRLGDINRDERFFARQVRLVRGPLDVLVTERVLAPDLETAELAFAVPVDDLLEIATDPEVAAH